MQILPVCWNKIMRPTDQVPPIQDIFEVATAHVKDLLCYTYFTLTIFGKFVPHLKAVTHVNVGAYGLESS